MKERKLLVRVRDLKMHFPVKTGFFRRKKSFNHAVDGISFDIYEGESVSVVGESGCGKTTLAKLLTRLYVPTAGEIAIRNQQGELENIASPSADPRSFRKRVQMIFQDPFESLNPRRTIFDTVAEPLYVQNMGNIVEQEVKVIKLLERVGLTPASSFIFRYPHELSGGQRQRVAIARALVIDPAFVIADEPTSMLDVSIRASVMNLMSELAHEMGVSYLYITHDLAVARYMSQRIAVMYLGKIVELGETEQLLNNPLHPYTRALISAVPIPDPHYQREAIPIKGGVSKPIDPVRRCRFYDRCPIADDFCRDHSHPPLEEKAKGQFAACYKVEVAVS